jgi:hypothetical protein
MSQEETPLANGATTSHHDDDGEHIEKANFENVIAALLAVNRAYQEAIAEKLNDLKEQLRKNLAKQVRRIEKINK